MTTTLQPGTPPPQTPRKRPTTAVITAVVAALLVVGGVTWYALADKGDGGGAKNTASTSPGRSTPSATGPSGPPAPDTAAVARYNTGRGADEARVLWLRRNHLDVPGLGGHVFGPWVVGDTVVTAMYDTVTAVSVADGTVRWNLPLDGGICQAPQLASADGKIVLALRDRAGSGSVECRNLQMIDLRTGRTGWRQKIAKEGDWDIFEYSLAISGNTVAVGRAQFSTAYRLSDGSRLFGTWPGNGCQPYAYAGGPKLVAAVSCPTNDVDKPQEEIHEVDPLTGKSRWKYRLPVGYRVKHVYSVRPLVVAAANRAEGKEGVVVLDEDGTKRSSLQGQDQYAPGCGDDVSDDGNLQTCQVVADGDTFYMATARAVGKDAANAIVAFDLDTGAEKRRIEGPPGRDVRPLRMEGGTLLVRVSAIVGQPGALASVAPGARETTELLRLPRSTTRVEARFTSNGRAVYVDGRYLLVRGVVIGESDAEEGETEMLMAFGK